MAQLTIFTRYGDALEAELKAAVGRPADPLYDMLFYQLGWRDEEGARMTPPSDATRLRGSLCLLTCEALLGRYEPALPAAAGVELIHNQSMVHGDVQVAHPKRGRRSTVWWLWGPGQAINAGDGLHALGCLALMRLKERGLSAEKVLEALWALDQACVRMYEGQHADLMFQERLDVTVDSYLEMAAAETGALMSCASELGALVATDDAEVRRTCRQVGLDLGVAYHIRNDILDLWDSEGRGAGTDNVLSKKKSLPIVYALERAEVGRKRELGSLYLKRVLEPADVDRLRGMLDDVGARRYAEQAAQEHSQRAVEGLKLLDIPDWAQAEFQGLAQYVVSMDG